LNNKIFSFGISNRLAVKWKRLSNDNLDQGICSNEDETFWYVRNAQIIPGRKKVIFYIKTTGCTCNSSGYFFSISWFFTKKAVYFSTLYFSRRDWI